MRALAFQRLDETGLLAADVGSGTQVHDNVHRVFGTEYFLAEKTPGLGCFHRATENVVAFAEFPADVTK